MEYDTLSADARLIDPALDDVGDFTFPAVNAPPRRPMRVALVASSYNYIRDGVALTLNRLVAYLEKAGVEVRVFSPVKKKPAFQHNGIVVPVPSIPIPGRSDYRLAFGLPYEELRAFQPDIMHVALAPDWLGFSALRAARKLGIPLVASYHTCYETYLEHYGVAAIFKKLMTKYLNYYYASCREVYVPTQAMIDTFRRDGMRDNFVLWQRGVDIDRFNPKKRSQEWRQSLGIGPQEKVVLFVSRLVREKQVATLASTFALLRQQGVAFRSVIVGDGPERQMLEQSCPDTIFTGTLQGDALAQAYASGDVFMFPSDTESFGNVTLEAMASGLPCVCADATGSSSLVVDGVTGFLAKPRNTESFTGYVRQLLEDQTLRQTMGLAARQRSLAFSWEVPMATVLKHYRALVGGQYV
ncbi:glycosyltransferase family 1 protein [Acetobacter vaccinii]|uniref:Glycosyltransferase family 1 protein n=2 Tax=Acetobacter vaccinii TaxID=2592655 RepID=A0A5C1YQM2_9PROT|nr:glycosyltransferase family 1 protein [Acetobacter vaccinii]